MCAAYTLVRVCMLQGAVCVCTCVCAIISWVHLYLGLEGPGLQSGGFAQVSWAFYSWPASDLSAGPDEVEGAVWGQLVTSCSLCPLCEGIRVSATG